MYVYNFQFTQTEIQNNTEVVQAKNGAITSTKISGNPMLTITSRDFIFITGLSLGCCSPKYWHTASYFLQDFAKPKQACAQNQSAARTNRDDTLHPSFSSTFAIFLFVCFILRHTVIIRNVNNDQLRADSEYQVETSLQRARTVCRNLLQRPERDW